MDNLLTKVWDLVARDPNRVISFLVGVIFGVWLGYRIVRSFLFLIREENKNLRNSLKDCHTKSNSYLKKIEDLKAKMRKMTAAHKSKLDDAETEAAELDRDLVTLRAKLEESQKRRAPGALIRPEPETSKSPEPSPEASLTETEELSAVLNAFIAAGVPRDVVEPFVKKFADQRVDLNRFRVWRRSTGECLPIYIVHKGTTNHRVELPNGRRPLAAIRQLEELNLAEPLRKQSVNWQQLLAKLQQRVSLGQVTTFGECSQWAFGHPGGGNSVRAMLEAAASRGNQLWTNRVVSDDGSVGAADLSYGQSAQLRSESVPFTDDGKVDLDRCPPVRL